MTSAAIIDPRAEGQGIREQIESLESAMLELPQVELRVRHYLADGLYAREIFIPAGTMLTGAAHLFEHINIVSKGCIEVVTESGSELITAPATFISKPGTKRMGRAIEDTVWTTIHANPENIQDVLELEDTLVADAHQLQSRRALLEDDQPWLS